MICSSENRFFTSNLRRLGNWTPNRRATQNRGDVGLARTRYIPLIPPVFAPDRGDRLRFCDLFRQKQTAHREMGRLG